jgi:NTP pyrophosphatase (non-canonical NTP hydrolase)
MKIKHDLVLLEALKTWGEIAQLNMLIEEMSELTKEICKRSRGSDNINEMIDEVADVTIMLRQVKIALGITDDELENQIDFKVNRIVERLQRHV